MIKLPRFCARRPTQDKVTPLIFSFWISHPCPFLCKKIVTDSLTWCISNPRSPGEGHSTSFFFLFWMCEIRDTQISKRRVWRADFCWGRWGGPSPKHGAPLCIMWCVNAFHPPLRSLPPNALHLQHTNSWELLGIIVLFNCASQEQTQGNKPKQHFGRILRQMLL